MSINTYSLIVIISDVYPRHVSVYYACLEKAMFSNQPSALHPQYMHFENPRVRAPGAAAHAKGEVRRCKSMGRCVSPGTCTCLAGLG